VDPRELDWRAFQQPQNTFNRQLHPTWYAITSEELDKLLPASQSHNKTAHPKGNKQIAIATAKFDQDKIFSLLINV